VLDPGDRRAGTPRLTKGGGDGRIVGQTRGRLEPAETARQRPEGRSLGPPINRAGDIAFSVALAQLHQTCDASRISRDPQLIPGPKRPESGGDRVVFEIPALNPAVAPYTRFSSMYPDARTTIPQTSATSIRGVGTTC
jgi:hypothetical protein